MRIKVQIECLEVCFIPKFIHCGLRFFNRRAFQPLVCHLVGARRVSQKGTVWVQHFKNRSLNFKIHIQMHVRRSNITYYSGCYKSKLSWRNWNEVGLVILKLLASFLKLVMHKNTSFKLLQFFSQTLRQNINLFFDCSFG